MEGQMWPAERSFLYNAVLERNPTIALEVGTWKGGGSTLQIATALRDRGVLYTCETNTEFLNEAVDGFSNSLLRNRINFNNIPSTELIKLLIATAQIPQFVFFDGPEDPNINIEDFKLLDRHLAVGAYFCMHDWDLEIRPDGLVSSKAALLRPYLEQLSTWKIMRALTAPLSVGIVLAVKVS